MFRSTIDSTRQRRGYTLLELMAVMAALLVLGVMILPTLSGIRGNTNIKASADILRSMLAQARAKAIEDGRNYRLALSSDGRTLQLGPDVNAITGEAEQPSGFEKPITRTEELPKGVTLAILDDDSIAPDVNGLLRIATLLPDGTCREDSVFVQLSESGVSPMTLRIRGLTGNITIVPNPNEGQP